jgi:hypothetical protein
MRCRYPLLLSIVSIGIISSMEAFASSFGTYCQREFQNNWQITLRYMWDRCGGFVDELDDTDSKLFYFNLHGVKWRWEQAGDQDRLDNVDLFYGGTHTNGWETQVVYAMGDQNQLVGSDNMRLGDEATGLSIFSIWGCYTLKFDDNRLWVRMGPIMRGGLRYATGSHGLMDDGWTTDEQGEDYADNLQKGLTIKYAWKDGNADWASDQDVAVMATGTDKANCESRPDGMKWRNFRSYPRLADGRIGWYCYWYWNNL